MDRREDPARPGAWRVPSDILPGSHSDHLAFAPTAGSGVRLGAAAGRAARVRPLGGHAYALLGRGGCAAPIAGHRAIRALRRTGVHVARRRGHGPRGHGDVRRLPPLSPGGNAGGRTVLPGAGAPGNDSAGRGYRSVLSSERGRSSHGAAGRSTSRPTRWRFSTSAGFRTTRRRTHSRCSAARPRPPARRGVPSI